MFIVMECTDGQELRELIAESFTKLSNFSNVNEAKIASVSLKTGATNFSLPEDASVR